MFCVCVALSISMSGEIWLNTIFQVYSYILQEFLFELEIKNRGERR